MNLHEYQGKEMLNSFGVEIQRGIVAQTPAEAIAAAKKINRRYWYWMARYKSTNSRGWTWKRWWC